MRRFARGIAGNITGLGVLLGGVLTITGASMLESSYGLIVAGVMIFGVSVLATLLRRRS
jgi:hypothetical protein